MKRKMLALISAIILATLTFLPFGTARAAVVTVGCGGDSVCFMEELLGGATIQVDDKLFRNFRNYSSVATGGASAIDPGAIQVTDYKVFGGFGIDDAEIGIVYFSLAGNTIVGGQTLSTSWLYTVESLGPAIVDNTLHMSGGGFADVEDGASAIVREVAMDVTGLRIVQKEVFQDTRGLQETDHQDFAPHTVLDISTQMLMDGGDNPNEVGTQLLFLVQSFSQQQVPEPTTLGLFAIGLAALGFRTRRSSRRSTKR